MSFYYLLYFPLLLLLFIDNDKHSIKEKRNILIALSFLYSIIGGFGNWDGSDWSNYKDFFYYCKWSDLRTFVDSSDNYEWGYTLLNVLFKSVFGNFTIFMFFCTLFYFLTFTNLFIKYAKYPLVIFVLFFFSSLQFCIVRNRIALAILIYAIPFIFERKLIKFLLITCLATLIHRSSIIFILPYLFSYVPVSFITCNAIVIASSIAAELFQKYFFMYGALLGGVYSERIDFYTNTYQSDSVSKSIVSIGLNVAVVNILLFYDKKINKDNKMSSAIQKHSDEHNILRVLIYTYILTTSLDTVFMGSFSDFARLGTMLSSLFFFAWDYVCRSANLYFYKYRILYLAIFVFYVVQKFYHLYIFDVFYSSIYVPYNMCFK